MKNEKLNNALEKTKNIINNAKESLSKKEGDEIINKLDQNEDGKVDLKDFIIMGLKVPGVHINRREFLKSSFSKKCSENIVDLALEYSPKYAGIENAYIESVADDVIAFERKCATASSAALGVPGGAVIPITLTADISQYFAFLLRAAQKLMYVYGFPDLNFEEGKEIDEKTMNTIEIAIGVMLGVQGADTAIRGLSKGIISGLKAGAGIFGKLGFGVLGKAIPVLGGVVSGGLTYATFAPSCEKLRKELRNNPLNDPSNFVKE